MRETKYMREIASVSGPSGETIERIYVKAMHQEEIRFSWWKNGRFASRPLDVTEEELLPVITKAIRGGVFTPEFLRSLQTALNDHLDGGKVKS